MEQLPKAGTRTARGRLLASRLVALREARKLTRKEVNERCRFANTACYRIETEDSIPHASTLNTLLTFYGVTESERDEILALAVAARAAAKDPTNERAWLHEHSDKGMPDEYLDLIGFETDAARNSTVGLLLIPGLLQTEDYARAVIKGTLPQATVADVERRVRVRMQRQGVLGRDVPLGLHVILDEAALWRSVGGPDVMAQQLRTLAQSRPNVRIQVIPYSAGAHPGMINSFVILSFGEPGIPDLVYSEIHSGEILRGSEEDIIRHRAMFDELAGQAMTEDETRALLKSAARKHKR